MSKAVAYQPEQIKQGHQHLKKTMSGTYKPEQH